MGHNRLGQLPNTRPWQRVVAHIAEGHSAAVVAESTATAALHGLERGRWDRGVAHVVYLLARTALAARQADFAAALAPLGITVPQGPTLFDLTAGFATAVQEWHTAHRGVRTDLGELAALAALEAITARVGDGCVGIVSTGVEVQAAVRDFSTPGGFAVLGHDYHARFVYRFLMYHLGRELSQHVGGCGRFADHAAYTAFVDDLNTHCREATLIVREFVGKWYSKAKFERGITERQARGFSARSLEKIQGELTRRGKSRG